MMDLKDGVRTHPQLIGTKRTLTEDPTIADRHLAKAVRDIAKLRDVTQIYELAAIYSAKEQAGVQ